MSSKTGQIVDRAILAVAADAHRGLDRATEAFNQWVHYRVQKWFLEHWQKTEAGKLQGWTSQDIGFVVDRVVDQVCAQVLPNLEPWRVGSNWRKFPSYVATVVNTVCVGIVLLNEEPCQVGA